MSSVDKRLARALECHRGGRISEAKRLYQEIVAQDPKRHEVWAQLGLLSIQEERYESAAASFARAVSLAPAVADYHANLGIAHGRAGRLEDAVQSMSQAVAIEPHRAEAHYNLAVILGAIESEYALPAFERAAQLAPRNAQIRRGFAAALTRAGSLALAAAEWRQVVALEPGSASHWVELATVLRRLGENDASIDATRRALELDPRSLSALAELGSLIVLGRLDEAEDALRQAIEHEPSSVPALFNLSSALAQLGRVDESVAMLRRILELQPDERDSRSNLLMVMNWSPTADREDILREAVEFGSRHGPSRAAARPSHTNSRDAGRRLRVGYFSADFGNLTAFLPGLFEHHDREAFEITCYSGVPRDDADVGRMRQNVHRWQEVSALSDAALIEAIRSDRIDVLVDLTMHMAGCRLGAFAGKPAPVQIAWLAYPGTTGVEAIDYRLTDPHLDPPDASSLPYTERSLWLPDSFWLYGERLSDCEPGPLPAERNGFITFGSLNTFAKYHEGLAALWSGVLRAVEHSRLLLLAPPGRSRDRVLRAFEGHGIAAGRIEFVSQMPMPSYFETYRRIDVGLDTFPCNGHTTTLDAAWMGVPVVSRIGDKVVGRGGLSILQNLGLPELASETDGGFVATATDLARDRPRLKDLRETLRARLRSSALMDAPKFARSLERVYRTAFQRWCEAGL